MESGGQCHILYDTVGMLSDSYTTKSIAFTCMYNTDIKMFQHLFCTRNLGACKLAYSFYFHQVSFFVSVIQCMTLKVVLGAIMVPQSTVGLTSAEIRALCCILGHATVMHALAINWPSTTFTCKC